MADGGEGTVQSLLDAVGGDLISCQVKGPAGQSVTAGYGMLADNSTAVIEMAAGFRFIAGQRQDHEPVKDYLVRDGRTDLSRP